MNFIPADYRTPYVQSWHFTVQRELAKNLLLDVAYVGTHGTKLMVLGDWNEARPTAPRPKNLTVDQRRPIPGLLVYRDRLQRQFVGLQRAAGQATEALLARHLFLLNSFTWSKAIDYASGHLETANGDNSRVNLRDVHGRARSLRLRPAIQRHHDHYL